MIDNRVPSNLMMTKMARDIMNLQYGMAEVQEQIASGKKINRPSDNPAQAASLISMAETSSRLAQYERNSLTAESRLTLEESTITGTINALNHIRELVLSSNNGSHDDMTRNTIDSEVRLRLDELFDLANTRDSNGDYLFSGSNTQSRPFARSVPVTYSGSDDALSTSVGLGRTISIADSGADVFMRIRNGNGDFSVSASSANTGTGLVSTGSVSDRTLYDSTPYRIEFTSANQFDIIDLDSGTAVQTGVAYQSRAKIEFAGISTNIIGTPAVGDSFDILPSANQDVFSTVSLFSDALTTTQETAADRAQFQQKLNETLLNIDNSLDHLNTARAKIGNRLNSIDSGREENASMSLQLEISRTDIEDVDIAEAVTSLQNKASSLEIMQKMFVRVEGLTLFNYM
ncbi:MAG: flagellar hook-associated protein FlgL [Granulosicoccus sp.]|nr:flagellar hook-associated protein FlgL [Granulosicoccus sp.]